MASGSVYPMPDKWLTHSGGDMGTAPEKPTAKKKVAAVKPVQAVKPIARQGQLLDSTGKMTKERALAIGSDRKASGRR